LRYQVDPRLVGLIGYQIGIKNYTADELITTTPPLQSDARDTVQHYIYVGLDHDFTTQLRGSVRIGGEFTDYVHQNDDEISPYADASLTYVYMPGDSVRVGIRHDRSATDIVAADPKGRPTLDQEVTAGYVELTHQITRALSVNALGQIQYGTFNGGAADDSNEILYLLGLNLGYRIDQHWSLEAGYNYDMLDSDLLSGPLPSGKREEIRSYDRNRVYIGVRATY